ncbi:MAG: tyrosine recombinase XerD, partial [Mycoplasmataceae bacterium RV_VA103A]
MNKLLAYQNWLEKRNLTLNTIRSYLWAIKEYGERELTTDHIVNFLKSNLTKYQPSSLQVCRQALSSYAKFLKVEIEWEMINRIIPVVQRRFFTTIDEKELEQLKHARYEKENQVYYRNKLILDFLFYMGIRVSELVSIRHCDYQNKSLKIKGKGNKIRYIPVPDFLINCFNPFSLEYLFTTKNKKPLDPIQVRTMIYKKTKKAGIEKHISP